MMKKNREVELDEKDIVILQFPNDIMILKRRYGSGKKPIKKKINKSTSPQIPTTSGINLEDYAMDNFSRAHYVNHSKKTCLEFMNLFKAMILLLAPAIFAAMVGPFECLGALRLGPNPFGSIEGASILPQGPSSKGLQVWLDHLQVSLAMC